MSTSMTKADIDLLRPHEVAIAQYAAVRGLTDLDDGVRKRLAYRYENELVPALEQALATEATGGTATTRSVRDHIWLTGVIDGTTTLTEAETAELDQHVTNSVPYLIGRGNVTKQRNTNSWGLNFEQEVIVNAGSWTAVAASWAASYALAMNSASVGGAGGVAMNVTSALLVIGTLGTWAGTLGGINELFNHQDSFRWNVTLGELAGTIKRSVAKPRLLKPDDVLARLEEYADSRRPLPTPEAAHDAQLAQQQAEAEAHARAEERAQRQAAELAKAAERFAAELIADGIDPQVATRLAAELAADELATAANRQRHITRPGTPRTSNATIGHD